VTDSKKPAGKSPARKPRSSAPKQPIEEETPLPPTVEEVPYKVGAKGPAEPESEVDIYTLQIFFDGDEAVFRAGFLEFPELRVADESRKEAIYAAEDKLHSHLAALRQSGKPVPQPFRTREYPSTLEVPISQTLYRKLEVKRHQERVSMDQLVTEILTGACESRKVSEGTSHDNRGNDRNRRPNQSGGKGRGGQQQGRGGGGHRRGGYNPDTMDNRENFMEYVRNLEKGGGPGYKKR
jgi:predicted HicB family RNase H-like nuclease